MDDSATPALHPVYPFGGVGESIELHAGPLTVDGHSCGGTVQFRLTPSPSVTWSIDDRHRPGLGPVDLQFSTAGAQVRAEARCHRSGLTDSGGAIPSIEVGTRLLPMTRVVAHWLNLPKLCPSEVIRDPSGRSTYLGRWSACIEGWRIVLDQRSDHRDVVRRARHAGAHVATHVMEIRREDDAQFGVEDVVPVLDALQLGISFVLARAVAPILPVGFDDDGIRVWEQWEPRYCVAGEPGALQWWPDQDERGLVEFLDMVVQRYQNSHEQFSLRFLLTSGLLSATGGFVEQRIMAAFAAIEHLTWIQLVTVEGMSNSRYKNKKAAERLLCMLDRASVSSDIDGQALPAVRDADHWLPPVVGRDGPSITTWVRNRIVHPAGGEGMVYRTGGFLQESWLLTHHYLVLLILHHIGFTGAHRPLITPDLWASDGRPVPWAPRNGGRSDLPSPVDGSGSSND